MEVAALPFNCFSITTVEASALSRAAGPSPLNSEAGRFRVQPRPLLGSWAAALQSTVKSCLHFVEHPLPKRGLTVSRSWYRCAAGRLS